MKMAFGTLRAQLLWDNIKKGDLSSVVNLLQTSNVNLEERDENGQTFLMCASERGELNIVRELLEAEADVNSIDNDNWTALLCAAKEGHLEILIELLERGAVIEHTDLCGWTALMWACYKGRTMVVQEMMERMANPNIKAEHNMTCLAWAAGRGFTEIVKALIVRGAKVNTADKYGTTPLIWASRKGYLEIVEALLNDGANVDIAGMNSWTGLLVATTGGYTEVVHALLQYDPNVNSTDKDGFSALTIAAKEGHQQVVRELLSKAAYVNVADRAGDTILIHAVKGGHIEVVRALLNKYADVDVQGSEGKTALYWAVEKGHLNIVQIMLDNDPDLEICNKDGDTPLLRSVRSRNEECVKMLLDKGARVSAIDKRGDTCLHIALRARSKKITELLLRKPKHSHFLYKANKAGETPYSIDTHYQRGIMSQIFGHRKLNANDGENLLGYEIYSSALADILSEPSLNTPITVGLYAKWGSGKSFLLGKLQDEMKNFTQQNTDTEFQFTWVLFFFLLFVNGIIGLVLGHATGWEAGLGVGLSLFPLQYLFIGVFHIFATRYEWRSAIRVMFRLGAALKMLTLMLQVFFCNQQRHKKKNNEVPSVRFLFSDCTRLTSVGGEKTLAGMIETLCDALEQEYGVIISRLFRVFKPQVDSSSPSRFKSICCVPYFVITILVILWLAIGGSLLVVYGISDNTPVNIAMITFASLITLSMISSIYTWGQAISAIVTSQGTRITRAADQLETLKMGGFMQRLKFEVDLMSRLVTMLDCFTKNHTRLVVIVDGLDTCEQDKVLQVLDIVKALFSDDNTPFITILAVDPQAIIRGIEHNIRGVFQDSSINGFDYLRNIVHLPFYLQSQGVQMPKHEPNTPHLSETSSGTFRNNVESIVSSLSLSDHKPRKSKTDRSSAVRTSSLDLSHTLMKSDYFSDVNPRSMRRLMNIVAVTGRLLRAYSIDFSWHRLAAWINIIEQWPYRVSWIISYFEEEDNLDNSLTLFKIYEKMVPRMPASKEQDPLLEIDRNARKLEALLSSSGWRSSPLLNVGDLRKFLPCTISLDPYLRKLIREMQHTAELTRNDFSFAPMFPPGGPGPAGVGNDLRGSGYGRGPLHSSAGKLMNVPYVPPQMMGYPAPGMLPPHMMPYMMPPHMQPWRYAPPPPKASAKPKSVPCDEPLGQLKVQGICHLLEKISGINPSMLDQYKKTIQEHNISGPVLETCEIDELKDVMKMSFGDWNMFRSVVLTLREQDMQQGGEVADSVDCTRVTFGEKEGDRSENVDKKPEQPRFTRMVSMQSTSREDSVDGRDDASEGSIFMRSVSLNSGVQGDTKRRMTRNDSIVQQLLYENKILEEALEEFNEDTEEISSDEGRIEMRLVTEDNASSVNSLASSRNSTNPPSQAGLYPSVSVANESHDEETSDQRPLLGKGKKPDKQNQQAASKRSAPNQLMLGKLQGEYSSLDSKSFDSEEETSFMTSKPLSVHSVSGHSNELINSNTLLGATGTSMEIPTHDRLSNSQPGFNRESSKSLNESLQKYILSSPSERQRSHSALPTGSHASGINALPSGSQASGINVNPSGSQASGINLDTVVNMSEIQLLRGMSDQGFDPNSPPEAFV